jgi:hypothetical protein
MTCKKLCEDCKCTPCGHLSIDDNLYVEIDDGTFAFVDLKTSEIERLREQKRSISAYAQEIFNKKIKKESN